MAANRDLPTIHILKVRSTLAAFLAFLGTVAPLLPEGWREVAAGADPQAVLTWFDQGVAALTVILQGWNELITVIGIAWMWWERRAPNYRLSLTAPLFSRSGPTVIMMIMTGIGLLVFAPGAARAQGSCDHHDAMVIHLAERWGETRQAIMLDAAGSLVELYASAETGTWTITLTPPGQLTCMVASGQAFDLVSEPLESGAPA